jgi:hypothetical protein
VAGVPSDASGNVYLVMNAIASQPLGAPAQELITTDTKTLAAAMHLAYLAGRGDAARAHEALDFISRTCRNTLRSLRRARPVEQSSVEALLELLLRASDETLGAHAESEIFRA